MTVVDVENLVFTFDNSVEPFQYEAAGTVVDGWPNGTKVADVIANELPSPPAVTWLVEAKDFRVIHNPPKLANIAGLAVTMMEKADGTIAGMIAVSAVSTDAAARAHATSATQSAAHRVVLHLEPHPAGGGHSNLFPVNFSANVWMKLKPLVSHIDPHPLVLSIASTQAAGVPWEVA